ncbi:MAG TPA: hypothetical protein VK453_25505 [Micromonosporaceae bacterium]|nr:hypothetical protein [Micromonosporaceae bacterium]
MSAFTIAAVVDALSDGPISVDELLDKLDARTRLGEWHPDFGASLNHAIHQGKVRFVADDCTFEHNGRCVLEATR